MVIGKKIKKVLDLDNDGICDSTKSWLIKDYTVEAVPKLQFWNSNL
jgi:hypothetical protein